MTGLVDRAEAMIAAGGVADGVALVRDAAMRGDPDALFRLSAWRLIGQPIPRDLPAARRLLRAAVEAGHPEAALREVALTANGSGAPPDWAAALALLRAAAARDARAAAQVALLDAMALDVDGGPGRTPSSRPLAERPEVRLFPAFATPAECRHVMSVAATRLEPALVVDPASGQYVRHPVRTSHEALFGPVHEDLVVRALNLRLAAASGTDVAQGEALVVLRYEPGQEYRLHHDAFPPSARNQRDRTLLLYLNDGYEGGETHFPRIDVTVRGRCGDMLLFGNVDGRGLPDPLATHAGLPVRAGAKWLATRWVRRRAMDPWTVGVDAAFGPSG